MNALQIILVIIITLAGYPIGSLLAKATREELRTGRKYFKIILTFSLIAQIISLFFLRGENLFFFIAIMIFIFLLTLASFIKSRKVKK